MTINKVCGSGLKAVALAAQAVQLVESEIVLAGGMESMSNCPYLLPQARTGYRIGDGKLVDSMIADGLWDAYDYFHMGMTGELVAEKYGITREEQDRFAVESHQKAVRARKSCFLESQILPIEVPQKKGDPIVVKYDESPREDTSLEALSKLKPAFKKAGPVTVAAIAVTRQLKLNPEKVNVNGGAVAIGHPIGASGARILVTLLYELARRNLKRGVAALCLGGGNAVALAVERL